jgi:hypothetical protein
MAITAMANNPTAIMAAAITLTPLSLTPPIDGAAGTTRRKALERFPRAISGGEDGPFAVSRPVTIPVWDDYEYIFCTVYRDYQVCN